MHSILHALRQKKVLVSDGAWGTMLQKRGLQPGECPEVWNVTHREDVEAVARGYINAGSDCILTNSFGGHPVKLKHFGFEEQARELNRIAAEISREAAGNDHFVLGSMGPTGTLLMMGEITEGEMYDGFAIQAEALKIGGVDAICVETMSDLEEATIAVKAAREATGLEVFCTFTFEQTLKGEYRTMMGLAPSMIVQPLKEAGACIIGTNCGNGMERMIDIVKELRTCDSEIPILVHANAGIPTIKDGITTFPETPEGMASYVPTLIVAGASIIGGCCGTTSEHVKAIAYKIREYLSQLNNNGA
ncbi:MAG: homocysteine S-methyltransferase family protein [Bacteroidetes bacterium]|nr:homocysteine S-methyltransferase family protein [Bacteroidota bacterium]